MKKTIRRLIVDLLQNRTLGVVVEVPFVIRYTLSFQCSVVLYFWTLFVLKLQSRDHFSSSFFVFLFSFVLFFSVYILLSSTKVVALDDLHGEFSMDL